MKGLFLFLLGLLTACGALAFLVPIMRVQTSVEPPAAVEEVVPAEIAAPRWYFALTNDGHEITAFNADGESHVLLQHDDGYAPDSPGVHLEPDRALFLLKTESRLIDFALLTPDDAMIFDLPESLRASLMTGGGMLVTYAAPYALVSLDPTPPTRQLLLLNTDTGAVTWLTDLAASSNFTRAPLSSDGRYVRFIEQESEDSTTWNYTEYDTQTQEKRIFYTIDETYAISSYSDDGAYWVYHMVNPDTDMHQLWLIQPQNEPELLYEFASGDRDAYRAYSIQGEFMVISNPACTEDCEVSIQAFENRDSVVTFTQPSPGIVRYIRAIDETRYLMMIDEHFWIQDADGSATLAGAFNPSKITANASPGISPDMRWLASLDSADDPMRYRITDLQTENVIMERDLPVFVLVTFTDYGFIVNENEQDAPFLMYRADTDSITELPGGRVLYLDMLPNSGVLYRALNGNGDPSVYRYDPDTGDSTLLLDNATVLYQPDAG